MEFLLLIILLLLFLILYPIIKVGFKVWSQMRQMRQMNRSFQNARSQYGGGNRNTSGGNTHRHRHRGKIFGPSDGEYVEFEEITGQRQSVQYIEVQDVEPRITDAKFEEIRL